jgi:hypothetical protein
MRGQGGVCAGGGSDPSAPHFRVGSAALVTPTPGTPLTQIWYRVRSKFGTSSGPKLVPDLAEVST